MHPYLINISYLINLLLVICKTPLKADTKEDDR